jgi:hypothetical protein
MKNMGIRPLAVFSRKDGTAEVLLDSDVLGHVCVRVTRDGLGKFKSDIIEEQVDMVNQGTIAEPYVTERNNVRRAGIVTVAHCLTLPGEWVVIGQGEDFDVLTTKKNLAVAKSDENLTYASRFPLFAS